MIPSCYIHTPGELAEQFCIVMIIARLPFLCYANRTHFGRVNTSFLSAALIWITKIWKVKSGLLWLERALEKEKALSLQVPYQLPQLGRLRWSLDPLQRNPIFTFDWQRKLGNLGIQLWNFSSLLPPLLPPPSFSKTWSIFTERLWVLAFKGDNWDKLSFG